MTKAPPSIRTMPGSAASAAQAAAATASAAAIEGHRRKDCNASATEVMGEVLPAIDAIQSQLPSTCRIFVLPRSGALAVLPEPWHFATMNNKLSLAAEFVPATAERWRKLVEAVLEDRPFERTLVSKTYDGLAIEPLYLRRADAQPLAGRAAGIPWAVMQRVDHPDPAAANAEALHDLENGATGLSLVFAGSIGGYGYGLDASEAAIARALDGIHLDAGLALDLDLGPQTSNAGQLVAAR